MNDPDLIGYALEDTVASITLNRPEKRNALSDRMIEALARAVARAQAEAKAAVICGAGTHFSAGLDLAEHVTRTPIEGVHHSRRWHAVFETIEAGTIPFFARCRARSSAAGWNWRLRPMCGWPMTPRSLPCPKGTRGIFVGGGGSVRVARLMGVARMTDMMLTGPLGGCARRAEAWNLCQYVVPAGTARDRAVELARKAATNAEMSNYAIMQRPAPHRGHGAGRRVVRRKLCRPR